MQCSILGYQPAGMCFGSGSRHHMSVTFCVWDAVIYLSMVELKSVMCDGDRGNRGIGSWEWSGVEWHRAERSGIRIIRIKIKEKCDIIAVVLHCQCPSGALQARFGCYKLSVFLTCRCTLGMRYLALHSDQFPPLGISSISPSVHFHSVFDHDQRL